VILDVFSRYAVGWTVQHRESAHVASELIAQVADQQQIQPGTLTVHADRGSSMTSKPVAFLLADLGVTKTHSRPTPRPTTSQRGAVQDGSSTAQGSRSASTRSSTPARTAATSSAGTTTSTAIPGSA
jgi:hypothetical protein